MSFPKKGNEFPESEIYAALIGAALRSSLGGSHSAVKTLVSWTGANERTVKNWLAGRYGPSGSHLVSIVRHSNAALESFLAMAGRDELLLSNRLATVEAAIMDLLGALHVLHDERDMRSQAASAKAPE